MEGIIQFRLQHMFKYVILLLKENGNKNTNNLNMRKYQLNQVID